MFFSGSIIKKLFPAEEVDPTGAIRWYVEEFNMGSFLPVTISRRLMTEDRCVDGGPHHIIGLPDDWTISDFPGDAHCNKCGRKLSCLDKYFPTCAYTQ